MIIISSNTKASDLISETIYHPDSYDMYVCSGGVLKTTLFFVQNGVIIQYFAAIW